MVHEVDGRRKGKEDNSHDHSEAEEVPHGATQRCSEDRDRLVVAQHVQQLNLDEESDEADENQIDVIVVDDRLKAHDFSWHHIQLPIKTNKLSYR